MHFKITTAGKAAAIRPTDNSDSYINNCQLPVVVIAYRSYRYNVNNIFVT